MTFRLLFTIDAKHVYKKFTRYVGKILIWKTYEDYTNVIAIRHSQSWTFAQFALRFKA